MKALLLTPNRLALLLGLLDRPRGIASSRRDLARAGLPYIKRFRHDLTSYWTLYHASVRLPKEWVARRRLSGRIESKQAGSTPNRLVMHFILSPA